MQTDEKRYQVFDLGKNPHFKPRLLKKSMKSKKQAVDAAKNWHDSHPDRGIGVYTLNRVRVYRPKKK